MKPTRFHDDDAEEAEEAGLVDRLMAELATNGESSLTYLQQSTAQKRSKL